MLLGIPLGVAAAEVIFALLRAEPQNWWIYATVVVVVFLVAMTNLAPVLLLPLFFKFRPVEDAELQNRIRRLAQRTNTPLCGIFQWSVAEKTRKANAAVVGWGNPGGSSFRIRYCRIFLRRKWT